MEPRFNATGRAAASDDPQRLYAFYSQFNTPPRRSRPHILLMAGIFAAGAIAGWGVSWWQGAADFPAMNPHPASAVSAIRTGAPGRPPAPPGIDPNELPYDGMPPAAYDRATNAHAVKSSPVQPNHGHVPAVIVSARTVSATVPVSVNSPQQAMSHPGGKRPPAAKAKHRAAKRVVRDREIERIKRQAADELEG